MKTSKRLFVNTFATYGRSVIAMGFTLFSSRWILRSLGSVDYGLYNLLGSLITFIVFLNTLMAGSSSRFFSYSIGKGDVAETKSWFASALKIHRYMALLLIVIGWPIGELYIIHKLNIPQERYNSCVWVFRLSLISAFVSMVSVPYVAMFTAKQRIFELSLFGIIQTALAFTVAIIIKTFPQNERLVWFAVFMVSIVVLIQITQSIRGHYIFEECKVVANRFEPNKLKKYISFTSWTLIGGLGGLFRDQGSAILLNVHFGPRINASYGIANQVSGQSNQLAAALFGAFAPEITASEARGDRKRMLWLSSKACKYGTMLTALFALPVIFKVEYILKLWLITPPPHAAEFCRLILIAFLVDRMGSGIMLAVNAHGRIALYQATVGGIFILTLPVAWIFLKMGFAPYSVGLAFIITASGALVGRIIWANYLFSAKFSQWLNDVLFPFAIIVLINVCCWYLLVVKISNNLISLAVMYAINTAATAFTSLFLFRDPEEFQYISKVFRKFTPSLNRKAS